MALRPLFCLFLSGRLRQVSLYAAGVNTRGHYQVNKVLGVGGDGFCGFKGNKLLTVCMFTLQNCRKVVVATNIAETSITISGIRHVIDSGMVKAKYVMVSSSKCYNHFYVLRGGGYIAFGADWAGVCLVLSCVQDIS